MILIPAFAYNLIVLDINIISKLRSFSGTVTQGAYSEGIILPIQFFAHAETGIAAIWVVGLALMLWNLKRNPIQDFRHRVYLWIACLLFLYLAMVLFSVGLEMFVVYGRIARLMAPFIVLLVAWAFTPIPKQYGWKVSTLFVAVISIIALLNFLPIINMRHYRVLQRYAYSNFEDVSFESTFGSDAIAHGFRSDRAPERRYKLFNAGEFYPITEYTGPPNGRVIVEWPHFYSNKAWHFEGMSAQTREIFDQNDIKMWFVDTEG